MRHFLPIAAGVDVVPLMLELTRQPHLWDQRTERKTAPGSPHSAMSDVWVRYRPVKEMSRARDPMEPHSLEMWPAFHALPALRPLLVGPHSLMSKVAASYLGGVLITRIPPGARIEAHNDRGSWHAEYFNCKVYLPLKSNDRCVNRCEDEAVVMRAGEVWTFDNLLDHSVENDGEDDRITLIVSMRCE